MEKTTISELKLLDSHYAIYNLLKKRHFLALKQFISLTDAVPSLATFSALFNNLPAEFWLYKKIYLQNAPLPQIAAPVFRAGSGLMAMELNGDTLLIDIGHEAMGPVITAWLGTFLAIGDNWQLLTKKSGLTKKLAAFNRAGGEDSGRAEQILSEMSFLLGTTLEELVTLNAESGERLIPALLYLTEHSFNPLIYLHNELKSGPKEDYAVDLLNVLSSIPLNGTPLHLILTDSPAFSDLLSPYVRELRPVLTEWYRQNPALVAPLKELRAAESGGLFSEDLLYWILRDFLAQKEELLAEYDKAAATCGIVQRGGTFGQAGSYTLIDLSSLEYSLADPRLLLKQGSRRQPGLLLILPLENSAFFPTLKALLKADNLQFASLSLLKRAIPLNESAIQLPMAFIDGLNGNIATLPAANLITAAELSGLISGQISMGVIASLPGSYLLTQEAEEELGTERLALAYDKEGFSLINELLFSLIASHRLAPDWSFRAIYYRTESPLEEGYIRAGITDGPALFGSYGGAAAILRSILGSLPKAQPLSPSAPPARQKSSSSFRLRV